MPREKQEFTRVEGTDAEVVANARMLCAELSRHRMTLAERGIECEFSCYTSGRVEMDAERVTREKL